jgi:hypothetical protein
VKKLRSAHSFAGVIGLPLNAFLTITPFRDGDWDGAPTPADEFAAFRNWLGVWVRRNAEVQFTSVSVVHAKPDGTDAHLHALLHLPGGRSSLICGPHWPLAIAKKALPTFALTMAAITVTTVATTAAP